MRLPKWWDSIRAIIALILVSTVCVSVFLPEKWVGKEELAILKDLAMMTITFYYVLKKRGNPNEKTNNSNNDGYDPNVSNR